MPCLNESTREGRGDQDPDGSVGPLVVCGVDDDGNPEHACEGRALGDAVDAKGIGAAVICCPELCEDIVTDAEE